MIEVDLEHRDVSEDKPEAYARIAKEDMMEEVSL
jgi:hypothetical protein